MTTTLEELRWTDAVELASPHPYVLATTVDTDGNPNAIGIGWFTIVSWKPPMVCISVAPPRHSYGNLEDTGEYVINFPSPDIAQQAWTAGTKSGSAMDKFGEGGLVAVPSLKVRPPAIEGATMVWECKVVNKVDAGDHRLYIADIVALRGDPSRTDHLVSLHYRELLTADYKAGTITPVDHK